MYFKASSGLFFLLFHSCATAVSVAPLPGREVDLHRGKCMCAFMFIVFFPLVYTIHMHMHGVSVILTRLLARVCNEVARSDPVSWIFVCFPEKVFLLSL
jgi:hypothetical protein